MPLPLRQDGERFAFGVRPASRAFVGHQRPHQALGVEPVGQADTASSDGIAELVEEDEEDLVAFTSLAVGLACR